MIKGAVMFIQICTNTADKPAVCCRLVDTSPEDGGRFLFTLDADGKDLETVLSGPDSGRSKIVCFQGLTPGRVYTVTAFKMGDSGWEKACVCKTVPSPPAVKQKENFMKKSAMRTAASYADRPASVVCTDRKDGLRVTLDSVEVM